MQLGGLRFLGLQCRRVAAADVLLGALLGDGGHVLGPGELQLAVLRCHGGTVESRLFLPELRITTPPRVFAGCYRFDRLSRYGFGGGSRRQLDGGWLWLLRRRVEAGKQLGTPIGQRGANGNCNGAARKLAARAFGFADWSLHHPSLEEKETDTTHGGTWVNDSHLRGAVELYLRVGEAC